MVMWWLCFLFQTLFISAARAHQRPGCVSRSVACSCWSSPHWECHVMYDWQHRPHSSIHRVNDRLVMYAFTTIRTCTNARDSDTYLPHKRKKKKGGQHCLHMGTKTLGMTGDRGVRVTQLNRHEHSQHSALRWNGMESCLSYNAIQATALAACGGVPVTLSEQETESLFPLQRHVFLTWSPSFSPYTADLF